jgi:hypothetical protein
MPKDSMWFVNPNDDMVELSKRYRELAPKVTEGRTKRRLQKSRMMGYAAEMGRGIIVQAMGTVLGAALIYLVSVAGGLLEGTHSVKLIAWIIILIGITGGFMLLLISIILRRQEFEILSIRCRLAEHEMAQKMESGTPLNIDELKLIQAGLIDIQSLRFKVKAEEDEDEHSSPKTG